MYPYLVSSPRPSLPSFVDSGGSAKVHLLTVGTMTYAKKIPFENTEEPCLDLLRREITQLLQLGSSDHVVKILAIDFHKKTPTSFLMPYYNKKSLFEVCKKDPLTDSKLFNLALKAAAAVAFLHNRQIIHRDVKPDNFFVQEKAGELSLVIGDLASACHYRPQEPTYVPYYGTEAYVPPETYRCAASTNTELLHPSRDVWGYGCTVAFMLDSSNLSFSTNILNTPACRSIRCRSMHTLFKHKTAETLIFSTVDQVTKDHPHYEDNGRISLLGMIAKRALAFHQENRASMNDLCELFASLNLPSENVI